LRFEQAFTALFPQGSILRSATVFGRGSQIQRGLDVLAKRWLVKRLRITGTTDVPWIERDQLSAAVRRVAAGAPGQRLAIANERGYDMNTGLDGAYSGPFKIRVPTALYMAWYRAMGMPHEFVSMTMADVRKAGWPIVQG
jgi:hypothetical protein